MHNFNELSWVWSRMVVVVAIVIIALVSIVWIIDEYTVSYQSQFDQLITEIDSLKVRQAQTFYFTQDYVALLADSLRKENQRLQGQVDALRKNTFNR